VAESIPRAPAGLDKAGRALWRGILTDVSAKASDEFTADLPAIDLELLAQACAIKDRIAALDAVVKRDGVTSRGSKGQKIVHPAVGEIRQQQLALSRLLTALGIEDGSPEVQADSPATIQARKAAAARYSRRDAKQERLRLVRETGS
jgi:P27 family predicted phage terminase small subunit